MSGDWLKSRGPASTSNVSSFRPSGMSDDDENSDYYDDYSDGSDTYEPSMQASLVQAPPEQRCLGQRLKMAIALESIESVKKELEKLKKDKNFDINKPLDEEWNALLYACYAARPQVLKMLIEEEGADPLKTSEDHLNGLMVLANSSIGEGQAILECADLLVQADVNLDDCSYLIGASALHFAVKEQKLELIDFLCEKGADVNVLDAEKKTPLDWAAGRGFGPIVKLLLKNYADPHAINRNGLCAYEVAAFNGFRKLAKTLYLYGKAEDKKSVDLTPLDSNEECDDEKFNIQATVGRDHIGDILSHLKLQKYLRLFHERQVTLAQFLQYGDEDFVQLGITAMGERIKLMDTIRQIHNCDWKQSSLMTLSGTRMTASETLMLCDNFKTHLELMTATMKYLHNHALVPADQSSLLNPGLENKEPGRIYEFCGKLVASAQSLLGVLGVFKDLVAKFKNDAAYRVGDVISDNGK